MARLRRTPFGSLALSLIASLAGSTGVCAAQSPRPAPARRLSPAYPNSSDGLRQFLNALLAAARKSDPGKLDELLVEMEIPDPDTWFRRAFGPEKGASDADLYARTRDLSENNFEKRLHDLAGQSGEFQVRQVNDEPRGAESALLQSLRQHTDIYFASWKTRGNSSAPAADLLPYPYFVFINGNFRWYALHRGQDASVPQPPKASSQISEKSVPDKYNPAPPYEPPVPPAAQNESAAPSQPPRSNPQQPAAAPQARTYVPGKDGVGYPACVSCPSPAYPASARADRLEGNVVLRATIGTDGHASGITLVSTDALVFDEYAIAAVRDWRFKPAAGPDGKPVPVVSEIEVKFRLPTSP